MKASVSILKPFHVIQSNTAVQAFSSVRLPFEPKGWLLDFRAVLRMAVSQLNKVEGGILYAEYGSINPSDFADIENVLFYNVGASSFKNIAADEILFERLPPSITKARISSFPYDNQNHPFFYSYQLMPAGQRHLQWQGDLMAEWKDIKICRPSTGLKPLYYWRILKENPEAISIYTQQAIYQPFGLDIVLTAPSCERTNLTAVMKPMLDGVICAFHTYKEPHDIIIEAMCDYLKCSSSNLLNLEYGILGKEIYVNKYRDGIKWNPNDDRCCKVRLSVQYGSTKDWRFSGKLFRLL